MLQLLDAPGQRPELLFKLQQPRLEGGQARAIDRLDLGEFEPHLGSLAFKRSRRLTQLDRGCPRRLRPKQRAHRQIRQQPMARMVSW
jgi:hypothetical protein